MKKGLFLLAVLAMVVPANAAVFYSAGPGSGAPGATLGGYTMTPAPPDGRPLFTPVTSATLAHGTIGFSPTFDHRIIGAGWATWSHGYGGDVYYSQGASSSSHALSPGIAALDFYIEPNPFSLQTFTATDSSGTTSGSFTAHGASGAKYVGFYGTGGQTLGTISITGSTDYAIGEFRSAVPEPASFSLLALGALAVIRRRR